ncbi:MAG: type I-E CRISPR-associated protein Cas6/Cse3/CasE [Deferrisomatales bacterium]
MLRRRGSNRYRSWEGYGTRAPVGRADWVDERRDPARFGDQLRQGFGPAKGFGCGLMRIRRV